MGFWEFIILLVIAGICGSIAQSLVGYSHAGCLGSIALGFIGAMLGAWIARALDLPIIFDLKIGDTDFPVVWSIAGGAIFAAILALIVRPRRPMV